MPSDSIIEQAARVLWDEAEKGSDRERYSWDHLTERAATGEGDYAAIRESWLAPARALADAGLLAQQPDAAPTVDAYLMPKGWKPSGDMLADIAAADGVLIAGRVMPSFDPDAPTCGDVDGPGGKSRRCLREPGHDGDHANGGRWATAPATEDEVAPLRTFELHRDEDESGISGTGVVVQGVIFADGKVAMRWIVGEHRSTVLWDSLAAVEAIHGHGGRTRLVWTGGTP